MLINLKVKTLDAQTHEFSIDNEITVREFKDKIAEKTNIAAEQQRIIYCGRVLANEMQLKDYDVNGKVVHVAVRPPPSALGPSSNASNNANDQAPRRTPRGLRTSPLFRALDGMVVGTMAIPMNAGVNNAQMAIHPFTSSSSFCMNRITVARHMLECANNIAAFLEDPSRGLNNSSLDILAQGRWTMESTVVEVGITAADIPQNQNIVDMLQGAVSAALRRNGNTNVTVVQLPTVFGSNENTDGTQTTTETTAVVVEDPMEDVSDESGLLGLNTSTEDEMDGTNEDDAQQAAESNSSSGAAATAGTSSSSTSVGSSASGASASSSSSSTGNTAEQNSSSRRRTGTNILADVIDQMRAVQTRLNPFVEQFYDMLRNEPTFEENDTTGRENAQRLYDRVSEAFHYMSHAQHAISDLLLDVSQPAPRYLACRPILVEQSGYVSSNNYLSAAAAAAAAAAGLGNLGGGNPNAARQQQAQPQRTQQQQQQQQNQVPEQQTQTQAQSQYQPSPPTAGATNTGSVESVNIANAPVEDPVDDPIVTPIVPNNAANGNAANNDNHQMQVARLIQAVVNSAPIDTEFHVQINAPSIVSFGVPLNASAAGTRTTNSEQGQSEARAANANATETNANSNENSTPVAAAQAVAAAANGNATEGSNLNDNSNQTRSTTATLPTTATQTRSTSRPHVQMQMGGMPPSGGWNGRVIPANMMSSFDRFLPCNSHHIREPENANTFNANSANAGPTVQMNPGLNPSTASRANQRTLRTITDLFRHVRPPPLVSSSSTMTPQRSATQASNNANNNAIPPAVGLRSATTGNPAVTTRVLTSQPSATSSIEITTGDNETHRRIRLRVQLLNFISDNMFDGVPISDDTMTLAVDKALRWIYDKLIFLPQYDLPEYDSRDSVEVLLRRTLPLIINLVNDNQENPSQFEHRLKNLCEQLFKRLFGILHVCAGRMNAELYWGQLMRSLLVSLRSTFHGEALQFLQIFVSTEVPTATDTDTSDVQQFLVHKNNGEGNLETDTDVEMAEVASTSQDIDNSPAEKSIQLPNVVPGSEPWHNNFPNEWLPIITHDLQRQRENPISQAPFSDAYISGMSAKRRKMIQSSKPPSDVKSLVADSVRRAIQATGVSTSTASNQLQSADEITAAIAADPNVQASYCETLRTSVRERLKKDADYKPDKFPQTSKFLNK